MQLSDIDTFTRHYLIAALWSSHAGDDPLDANYGLEDIATETLKKAYIDCQVFQNLNHHLLILAYQFYDDNGNSAHPDAGSAAACAGHDFWLTRAGAGVGFWDRGMGLLGEKLTAAATAFRSIEFYVGDDGKIYSM
jgi:hypothetical protein